MEMTTAAWPFWRTIPRFDREYSIADCVRAAGALMRQKEIVESEFTDLFSAAPFYFARSGRECLYLILKMLELRPRSRVGVPLYCCVSVFQAIAAAGHLPVFLDVDLNNYALDEEFLRENKDRIDALVVVHTFGYPANLERLRRCLAGRNVPVIEDCAHALLTEFGNSLAGTKSDAAFFSFAPHKRRPPGRSVVGGEQSRACAGGEARTGQFAKRKLVGRNSTFPDMLGAQCVVPPAGLWGAAGFALGTAP